MKPRRLVLQIDDRVGNHWRICKFVQYEGEWQLQKRSEIHRWPVKNRPGHFKMRLTNWETLQTTTEPPNDMIVEVLRQCGFEPV